MTSIKNRVTLLRLEDAYSIYDYVMRNQDTRLRGFGNLALSLTSSDSLVKLLNLLPSQSPRLENKNKETTPWSCFT